VSVGRFFRYLAPNLITLSSMIFGLVSLWSAHYNDFPLAAWMIIYAVLTDRIDGLVARSLKATSELGMQLDSFADFLNFGVAPSFLVLTYLSYRVELPYRDGTAHYLLFAACGAYMLCAVFRLARYNVLSDDQIPTKIFFGFPTTLTGGLIASRLVNVAGASSWFRGGIVAYDSQVKFDVLGVPTGPVVTESAAAAMAEGAARVTGADVGLGITGVAGPDDQEGVAPGTVFVGLHLPGQRAQTRELRVPGDRERVRQYGAISALDLLRRALDAASA